MSIAIPTERSEGGRERGERCLWQEERPERVAAVDIFKAVSNAAENIGHRNSSQYTVLCSDAPNAATAPQLVVGSSPTRGAKGKTTNLTVSSLFLRFLPLETIQIYLEVLGSIRVYLGGKGIFLVNLGRHQDATATNTTKKYPGIPVINVVLRGMAGRMQEGDREDSKVESVTLHRNSRSPAENY